MEQGRHAEAAEAAIIAAEKCVSYDLPRRTLAVLGQELELADPAAAKKLLDAAKQFADAGLP